MRVEYRVFTLQSANPNATRNIVQSGSLILNGTVVVNLGDEHAPHDVELTYLGDRQTHMQSRVNGTYRTIDHTTGIITGTRRHLEVFYPPSTES